MFPKIYVFVHQEAFYYLSYDKTDYKVIKYLGILLQLNSLANMELLSMSKDKMEAKLELYPKMIILDCDGVLVAKIKTKCEGKRVTTRKMFKDIPEILKHIRTMGIEIGLATFYDEAKEMCKYYEIDKYIKYWSCRYNRIGKNVNVEDILSQSRIDTKECLFFDDSPEKIKSVESMGILSILVNEKKGLRKGDIDKGLQMYTARQKED